MWKTRGFFFFWFVRCMFEYGPAISAKFLAFEEIVVNKEVTITGEVFSSLSVFFDVIPFIE